MGWAFLGNSADYAHYRRLCRFSHGSVAHAPILVFLPPCAGWRGAGFLSLFPLSGLNEMRNAPQSAQPRPALGAASAIALSAEGHL